jgi:hypothetical protein
MCKRTDGPPCSVGGCGRLAAVRRMCDTHYKRWQRTGDAQAAVSFRTLDEDSRFQLSVDYGGPAPLHRPDLGRCHIWVGTRISSGYGRLCIGQGRKKLAHRWAYERAIGPIPDGLVLDHLCCNRACVNPEHLEPVTVGENTRRGNHHRRMLRSDLRPARQWTA